MNLSSLVMNVSPASIMILLQSYNTFMENFQVGLQIVDSRQQIVDSRQQIVDSRQQIVDNRQQIVDQGFIQNFQNKNCGNFLYFMANFVSLLKAVYSKSSRRRKFVDLFCHKITIVVTKCFFFLFFWLALITSIIKTTPTLYYSIGFAFGRVRLCWY